MKRLLTISAVFTLLAAAAAPKAKAPTPQEKFTAAVFAAYEETTDDMDAFRGRLVALRAMSDAEGGEGEAKLEADKRYFDRLRQASKALLKKLRDRRAVGPTDTIVALTMEMLQPEERVDYAVGFADDLPRSAEAAARTDVFARLPKENRLGRRGAYKPPIAPAVASHGFPNQVKRLKSAEPFRLAADEPGYERAFAAACDGFGLHLYLKSRDPEAWKTSAGFDDFHVNVSVQPGELEPERYYTGSYREPAKWAGIEWESTRPGYRLAGDTLKVDFFVAKDAYYVHAFLPWTAAVRCLPKDGDLWYACMDCAAHGKSGSVGGAAVHEVGRGAHLTFRLSDDELRRLRLGALRQAAGDYLATRQRWETADFWSDPHLGDAPFYAAKVRPLADELDAAAKDFCARGDDIPAAEAEALVRTRFAAWSEFALNVERAREAHLLNSQDFFGRGE